LTSLALCLHHLARVARIPILLSVVHMHEHLNGPLRKDVNPRKRRLLGVRGMAPDGLAC
jgi:hypothetical protein